jgi:hypothetical protein
MAHPAQPQPQEQPGQRGGDAEAKDLEANLQEPETPSDAGVPAAKGNLDSASSESPCTSAAACSMPSTSMTCMATVDGGLLRGRYCATAGLHVLHSKGLIPPGGAGSMPSRLSSESTISPDEIAICLRDDGSKWLLGSGSFGDVRCPPSHSRSLLPCSGRPQQHAELANPEFHWLLLLHRLNIQMLACRCTKAGSTACTTSQSKSW